MLSNGLIVAEDSLGCVGVGCRDCCSVDKPIPAATYPATSPAEELFEYIATPSSANKMANMAIRHAAGHLEIQSSFSFIVGTEAYEHALSPKVSNLNHKLH